MRRGLIIIINFSALRQPSPINKEYLGLSCDVWLFACKCVFQGTMSKANGHVGGAKEKKPPMRGIGADGMPRLPPIPTSAVRREDPYAKSKLLKYRAAKEKQNLLTKIMLDNAVQAYEQTVDHNKRQEQKADSNEPAYPDQVEFHIIY